MSAVSDKLRNDFKKNDDIRDEGLTTPDNIIRYDDIKYGDNEKWQCLDVYRPKDKTGTLPVIVSVHGGGWVYGDKERYQFYCMDLAARGFVVVNFTYRLAPEYKFPSQIEDICLVFNWVLNNASAYGIDTDNIFAVGDSAGAHQLGIFVNLCTNEEYKNNYSFRVNSKLKIKAIALNCGKYTFSVKEKDNLTEDLMREYLPKEYEGDYSKIEVIPYVTENFPPTFIMTSTGDFLKKQMLPMAGRLEELNIPFVCRMYSEEGRELEHVFHCNVKSETAKKCNDDECDFFKAFIKQR